MLTDMTPTAGQLYGSQIPAMTMNVKTAVSIFSTSGKVIAFMKDKIDEFPLKKLSYQDY